MNQIDDCSLQVQSEAKHCESITPQHQIKTHAITSITPLTEIARSTPATVVTGTGSITATPTAFTDAISTTATSTTPTTGQETVLGKRNRRTSTKYDEDFEKPSIVVSDNNYDYI